MNLKTSQRITKLAPSGIRRIHDLVEGLDGVIDLTLGDTCFRTPDHIIQATSKALDDGYTHYTANQGLPMLREAIAQKLRTENRIDVHAKQVLVTSGATQALFYIMQALIDSNDEVIMLDPTYNAYRPQVQLAGGIPVDVAVKEERDFRPSYEDIEKALSPRTKMIIINTPANPTGAVFERNDLEVIANIAREHDLYVLSDELYEHITFDDTEHQSIASVDDFQDRTVIVNGPTKTYAMTGWRVAYIVANDELISQVVKLQQIDAVCAPAVSQMAAYAALTGPQNCVETMRQEYLNRRNIMVEGLQKCKGLRCKTNKSTYFSFPRISDTGMSSEQFVLWLIKEARVATVPGPVFGPSGEGFVRASYAIPVDDVKEVVERVRAATELLKL